MRNRTIGFCTIALLAASCGTSQSLPVPEEGPTQPSKGRSSVSPPRSRVTLPRKIVGLRRETGARRPGTGSAVCGGAVPPSEWGEAPTRRTAVTNSFLTDRGGSPVEGPSQQQIGDCR